MGTGIALALLAAALWGLAPVATKGALAGYSPEIISVVRLAVAAVLLRRLGNATGAWFPKDRWSWIGGVALGVDFILYNYGLRLTSAGVSGLVINVEVVSTIGLAVWLLGESLTVRRMLGSVVTLAGVLFVSGGGLSFGDLAAREHLLGNVLVMLAGISWSVFAVAQRQAPRRDNLFEMLAPIFTVAASTTAPPLLLPAAWHNPGGGMPTLMLGVLVVLCTAAVYVVYARCQELVDVSVLAVVIGSIPIFALIFAWLILGEPFSDRILIGGAGVLAGVLVISTERPATGALETTAVERVP
jgi:drug/metabolite transporter (DMT)-like permease